MASFESRARREGSKGVFGTWRPGPTSPAAPATLGCDRAPEHERKASEMVQPSEVYPKLDDVQIVDVREPYEWEAGHIAGAIHIPLQALMSGGEAGRVDRGRPVVAVCRVGNRSELATVMLQARGYDAANLEGGMEAWDRAGLPFEASDAGPPRVA